MIENTNKLYVSMRKFRLTSSVMFQINIFFNKSKICIFLNLNTRVPEMFYFRIFAFVQRSPTVRSQRVQRALSLRSSVTALRSPFAVCLYLP